MIDSLQRHTASVVLMKGTRHHRWGPKACGGSWQNTVSYWQKDSYSAPPFLSCIFIMVITSSVLTDANLRKPSSSLLQGSWGPLGRPETSTSSSLSTLVMGEATACEWDCTQVSVSLCSPRCSPEPVTHSFFIGENAILLTSLLNNLI